MNLLLLAEEQQIAPNLYALSERQIKHLEKVVQVKRGDTIRVGKLDGLIGEALYQGQDSVGNSLVEVLQLETSPPPALPLTLILALPRPNMLKRTLLNISMLGVKKIILLNSAKVEKSYWQSPVLAEDNIASIFLEGLEQAKDTVMPTCIKMPRFRPYVEDILVRETQGKQCLLAHPYQAENCPIDIQQETILAIGPEGGWNTFEVDMWIKAGFRSVSIGERILKVETAVPVLLSRLFPL